MSRRNGVITAFVDRVDAERGRVTLRYKGIEDNFCSGWVSIASPMSRRARFPTLTRSMPCCRRTRSLNAS